MEGKDKKTLKELADEYKAQRRIQVESMIEYLTTHGFSSVQNCRCEEPEKWAYITRQNSKAGFNLNDYLEDDGFFEFIYVKDNDEREYLISFQCYDDDGGNHHVFMDRIGLYSFDKSGFTFDLGKFKDTGLELPIDFTGLNFDEEQIQEFKETRKEFNKARGKLHTNTINYIKGFQTMYTMNFKDVYNSPINAFYGCGYHSYKGNLISSFDLRYWKFIFSKSKDINYFISFQPFYKYKENECGKVKYHFSMTEIERVEFDETCPYSGELVFDRSETKDGIAFRPIKRIDETY